MSEWCQNKDCCYKRNQNQIRGSKGNKYYQSNKASEYYFGIACSQGCLHSIIKTNADLLIRTIGEIGKQTTGVDDAWEFKHEYNYTNGNGEDNRNTFFLINYLQGVRHAITREQAQTPEQQAEEYSDWQTIDDTQAKELAITLGLAS